MKNFPPNTVAISLMELVLTSPQISHLFQGTDTHLPALSLVAQLVSATGDDAHIERIVQGALPRNYTGNTLRELPGMIDSARRKGFAEEKPEKVKPSVAAIQHIRAEGVELIVDEHGEPFIGIPRLSGGTLFHPVRSAQTKSYILQAFYSRTRKPLAKDAYNEVIDTLEAEAIFQSKRVKLHFRIGRHENAIYIDPGWDNVSVIRVTSAGWTIESSSPIRFRRSPGFGAMAHPKPNGDLTEIRRLLSLDDRNWILFIGFLVNAFRPDGPYMFLLVEGEQGSGKSLLCTIAKRIIDPMAVEKLRVPKSEHDIMIQAGEHHLLVYDNTSSIKWDMSDAFCSLATGAGFSTRKYYTDNESRSFKHCRPVVMNGIGQYADRPDLLERSIQLQLPSMPREGRKTEKVIMAHLEAALPTVFGALLDAMACALDRIDEVQPPTSIRMADAAHWLCAAEPALGLSEGSIVRAIEGVQEEMMADRVTNDPIVIAILGITARARISGAQRRFTGTVGELLAEMREHNLNDRSLPAQPSHLSNALRRLRPALKLIGVFVEFEKREQRGQMISIRVEGPIEAPEETNSQRMARVIQHGNH